MDNTRNAAVINDLTKTFVVKQGIFKKRKTRAVRGINLVIKEGETLGLVGESGCGKSTLAKMLTGLLKPSSGDILLHGESLQALKMPGKIIQYVFQDASSSLNPRKSVRQSLATPLKHLLHLPAADREKRMHEIFAAVNLRPDHLHRYPHQFSGGQAQRIGIARALVAAPRVIVLDEPVSALDVSVRAQVLNLLADLKTKYNLTYVLISHDLGVVEAVSNRVAVMYFGEIVETAPATTIFNQPRHHYTRLLAQSAPVIGKPLDETPQPPAILPDPLNPPAGCAFAERCPAAKTRCRTTRPTLKPITDNNHVACHYPA